MGSVEALEILLQEYLTKSQSPTTKAHTARPREDYVAEILRDLDQRGEIPQLVSYFLQGCTRKHSPRNMGHQVSAPSEVASLFEWVAAFVNQGSGVYEVSPVSNSIEKAMAVRLGELAGYPVSSDGFATHGGTLGNLTALLAARNVAFPSSWHEGTREDGVLLTGADAHYSLTRPAGIIGLGFKNVIKVPLDEKRRMRAGALERCLTQLNGRKVVAVVATSGSTPVGAFDPLEEIAEVCDRHRLWLHVDGAHGASVLLSRRHRHLVKGIDRSRSLVWDAHKLLEVAALCTFVLYRQREDSFRAFSQSAPYLFDPENPAEIDLAHRTMECTRRALAVPLWGVWRHLGPQYLEQHVDRLFQTTREFYELLQNTEDFVALNEPESNILCFRYRPPGWDRETPERWGELQRQLRNRLIREGTFYITQTQLDGIWTLRVAIMNSRTRREHCEELLAALRSLAPRL